MNEKLKPCPFCGGDVTVELGIIGSYVTCKKCDIDVDFWHISEKSKLIEAWNRRVNENETD